MEGSPRNIRWAQNLGFNICCESLGSHSLLQGTKVFADSTGSFSPLSNDYSLSQRLAELSPRLPESGLGFPSSLSTQRPKSQSLQPRLPQVWRLSPSLPFLGCVLSPVCLARSSRSDLRNRVLEMEGFGAQGSSRVFLRLSGIWEGVPGFNLQRRALSAKED